MRRLINTIKNHRNWLAYFSFKYGGSKSDSFTFETKKGLSVKVPRRLLHTYKECFFDESYTKGMPPNFDLGAKPTIIDVGANVGYFSLAMLENFRDAEVYSFEPIPVNFNLLRKYKEQNENLNWHIYQEAIGTSNDPLTLYFDASDSFTTAASIVPKADQPNHLEVKCRSLKNFVEHNNLDEIDFLKLDCEGSEYGILYTCPPALLSRIKYIALETHASKKDSENTKALNDYLIKQGFKTKVWRDLIWAHR